MIIVYVALCVFAIIRLAKRPKCKAVEFRDNTMIIYGYDPERGNFVKHRIFISDIVAFRHNLFSFWVNNSRNFYLDIITKNENIRLTECYYAFDWTNRQIDKYMNYPVFDIRRILKKYQIKETRKLSSQFFNDKNGH